MFVNIKFQTGYTTNVYSRVMIFSNEPPSLNLHRRHETSRIIPIELNAALCVDKSHISEADNNLLGNTNFYSDLLNEFNFFLYKCKQAYPRVCPRGQELAVPTDKYESTVSDQEDLFAEIMSSRFELNPDHRMFAARMNEIISNLIPSNKQWTSFERTISAWRVYLSTRGVVYKRPRLDDGTRPGMYYGIRHKGEANSTPIAEPVEVVVDKELMTMTSDLPSEPEPPKKEAAEGPPKEEDNAASEPEEEEKFDFSSINGDIDIMDILSKE